MLAYLDAATGSMIISAVAGGAAGLSVAGKMGMKRLKDKVGRKTAPDAEMIEQPEEELTPQPEPTS